MYITINIPDALPKVRVRQRTKELEESLQEEAKFFESLIGSTGELAEADDPWANPDVELPAVDTGIEDFSINHDHYICRTSNRL